MVCPEEQPAFHGETTQNGMIAVYGLYSVVEVAVDYDYSS